MRFGNDWTWIPYSRIYFKLQQLRTKWNSKAHACKVWQSKMNFYGNIYIYDITIIHILQQVVYLTNGPKPASFFFIFVLSQHNYIPFSFKFTFYSKLIWQNYPCSPTLGCELMTSYSWVFSHNHYTSSEALLFSCFLQQSHVQNKWGKLPTVWQEKNRQMFIKVS